MEEWGEGWMDACMRNKDGGMEGEREQGEMGGSRMREEGMEG